MTAISLEFLGEQIERVLREQAALREEMRAMREDIGVLANAIVRLESKVSDLIGEVRLLRMALTDHDRRLRKLEDDHASH